MHYYQSRGLRGVLSELCRALPPQTPPDAIVRLLAPNRRSARLLQLQAHEPPHPNTRISTAGEFIFELAQLAATDELPPPMATPLLREALMEQALDEAAVEHAPPFPLRSGLIRRVLSFHDRLRHNHPVDDESIGESPKLMARFETLALDSLDAPDDVGAERLVAQTHFLVAAMRGYRALMRATNHVDPLDLISWAAHARPMAQPCHVVVVGADAASVAELHCLRTIPGIQSLSVVVDQDLPLRRWLGSQLAANGHEARPGTADAFARLQAPLESREPPPLWIQPPIESPNQKSWPLTRRGVFLTRDREESMLRIAKVMKLRASQAALPPLRRVAIVVSRPLPYLYLAQKVFTEAGIPYHFDGRFPLAAEPYAAAIDLVLDFCESDGRRDSSLALLRSPLFRFPGMTHARLSAFASLTAQYRETGGFNRWRRLLEQKTRQVKQPSLPGMDRGQQETELVAVLELVLRLEQYLEPIIDDTTPLAGKLDTLRRTLEEFGRAEEHLVAIHESHPESQTRPASPDSERLSRARGAIHGLLAQWSLVVAQSPNPPLTAVQFRKRVHRALETETFESKESDVRPDAVHIVDPETGAYGDFDLMFLAGLNDGEWPAKSERDVFYPQWFLRDFGWASDHELSLRARSQFMGLLRHPRREIVLVRHEMEDDAPTSASPFLDDAIDWLDESSEQHVLAGPLPIVCRSEALRRGVMPFERPPRSGAKPGIIREAVRVAEPVSATALETYLRCPFKYLSRYLFHLEEEETIDDGLSPLERGRLVHEILHEGFRRWDQQSSEAPLAITPDNFDAAVAMFRQVAIEKLPPSERRQELYRLFGSGARPGALEWILRREISEEPRRLRLLEHGFRTTIQLREGPRGEKPWFVQIKGRVDRADIDARGQLHVFDYKTGKAPAAETTLQVPLYAMCLSQELRAPITEASYLSLRDARAQRRDDTEDASKKLRDVIGGIQDGRFAPAPYHEGLCGYCGYLSLCRKEIDETQREPTDLRGTQ